MAKTRKPPTPPPPPPPPPAPAETPSPQRKRKKKGRPSLLDLQRRSLRLQAQSPEAAASSPPRRDPNPSDDDEDTGRRRQKRLKSVLSGAGEEDDEEDAVEEEKVKVPAKATGKGAAASSDAGPTGTPLPDKKLLLFILDRLQKKDTYGVYSDPVDPEELPDYHEQIEHPMDFSTIREKLLNDSYTILEQFEGDVFLLTANAMSYNSEDTVYYRQARSIEALAKKDFENLRQASDSEEDQPKTAPRRGRPPKNAIKPAAKAEEDVSPDLSNVKTNKSADYTETRKRFPSERARNTNIPMRDSAILHQHNTFGSFSGKRTEKSAAYSGPSKYGKKTTTTTTYLDDDPRSTYDQQDSHYSPLFSALDCERKQLIPIGLQQQLAYARSLARFAAKLGPVGWDIAAKGIRRVLPPGTKFGPGWVVDGEPPQNNSQWPGSTDPSAESSIPSCGTAPKSEGVRRSSEPSPIADSTGEELPAKNQPAAACPSAGLDRSSTIASKVPTYENGVDGVASTQATPPLQQQSHGQEIPSNDVNGITAAVTSSMGQYAGQGLFGPGMQMTHAQVLGMFSGVNGRANGYLHGHPLAAESVKAAAQNGVVGKAATVPLQEAGGDENPKGGSFPQKEDSSAAPSLDAGSPPRGKVANPMKHPDLVLQL